MWRLVLCLCLGLSSSVYATGFNSCEMLFQTGRASEQSLFKQMHSLNERYRNSKFANRDFQLKDFDLPARELLPTIKIMLNLIDPIITRISKPGYLNDILKLDGRHYEEKRLLKIIFKMQNQGQALAKKPAPPYNQAFAFIMASISLLDMADPDELKNDLNVSGTVRFRNNRDTREYKYSDYVSMRYQLAAVRLLERSEHPYYQSADKAGRVYDLNIARGLILPLFLIGKPFDPRTRVYAESLGMGLISIMPDLFENFSPSGFADHDTQHIDSKSHHLSLRFMDDGKIKVAPGEFVTFRDFEHERENFMVFIMQKLYDEKHQNPKMFDRIWFVLNEIFHEHSEMSHPIVLTDTEFVSGYTFNDFKIYAIAPMYRVHFPEVATPTLELFTIYRLLMRWTYDYLSLNPENVDLARRLKLMIESPDRPMHSRDRYEKEKELLKSSDIIYR